MKAWETRNGVLGLHDVAPAHPPAGHTVICVSHTGICGSDVPKLLTPSRFPLPEPWRPGHEIAGTDQAGRTIAVDPLVPCSTCQHCVSGDSHLCPGLRRLGHDLPGGFAEQVVIPAANAHPVPAGTDPLRAALADPAAVAIHGLRCNPVGPPGRLAVIGAGTVGLLTALYAHQKGWEVTVVHRDGHAPHEALTKPMPATFSSPAALHERGSFDLVIDAATGADPAPLNLALRLVDDGGTVIVQNAYHPEVKLPAPLRDLFRRSIRLIGSFSHCRRYPGDFALALDLLSRHASQVAKLSAHAGNLEDLPAVLSDRVSRSVRPVLTIAAS
jgi:threonine dehydrogenase-like Zn-dependent dehydrogenase